jgi:L-alanine-DL-glutamate epimerase-like enolase superfamily enzyme
MVLHNRFSHDAPRDAVWTEEVILRISDDQSSVGWSESKILELAEVVGWFAAKVEFADVGLIVLKHNIRM